MSDKNAYFKKLPLINYQGSIAINLLQRVDFNKNVKSFSTAFYPYTIDKENKIDHIAFNYYDDSNFDWLIYHANDIIDPYYDVPLTESEFNSYIIKKYGSIRNAQRTVIEYQNNFEKDDTILSVAAYSALPSNLKKYWDPVLTYLSVAGFERSKVKLKAKTNKIISFNFTSEIETSFEVNSIVVRSSNDNNRATVVFANTSSMTIKDIHGTFDSNANYTISSDSLSATVDYTTVQTIANPIPAAEQIYYSPVYVYDYEVDLNEQKRNIKLVDNSYKNSLNKKLSELMS
jgi:hypothetical protein